MIWLEGVGLFGGGFLCFFVCLFFWVFLRGTNEDAREGICNRPMQMPTGMVNNRATN